MDTHLAALRADLDHLLDADLSGLSRAEVARFTLTWLRLMDRAAVITARVMAQAERHVVHIGTGYRSVADWAAAMTNTQRAGLSAALGVADALTRAPELAGAVEAGDITAAVVATPAVREAIRSAPLDADINDLVEQLRAQPPRDAGRIAEAWRASVGQESPEQAEARRYEQRSVTFSAAVDGLVTATATLPELAASRLRAVLSGIAGKPCQGDERSTPQRLADGLIQLVAAYDKGEVRGGRERTALLLVAPLDTWTGVGQQPGRTAEGVDVPAHVVRRCGADALLQRVATAGSHVVDLGRSARWATDQQWRALVARDQHCRWPGCSIPATWCDIDHVPAWEHGGVSDLDSMMLFCRHHHTVRHGPGVTTRGDARRLTVTLANGTVIHCGLPGEGRERPPPVPTAA